MPVEQRRQRPKIFCREPLPQPLALNRAFNEERVDQHEAVLEELQRQGDHFLLFSAIRGQFALTTIADEVIGRVPVLDDVESFVDLPLKLLAKRGNRRERSSFQPFQLRQMLCKSDA